ncbi:uncharacterized protein [Halyomorpha halys]|uniref:uncharacterized protein n=1 Tax=Halyomorpha halys TaxID=286706 RepID=UPI0006D525EF|nr:uncharacterized protein LOC106685834 [Halyomorpha halys]
MECLCRHFQSPTYNRDILTRTDHMNLLATPRGYRWYGPGGELPIKARAFRGRSSKKKEKEEPVAEVFPGMAQFMNGVWSILTPNILLCLRDMLIEEFDMTPRGAVLFLMQQYIKSQRAAEMERIGYTSPTEDQYEWACHVAGTIASKMTQYSEMLTDAKRNKRTVMLFKAILERLQKAFGIKPDGDTPLSQLLMRFADGLAVWLTSIPGENAYENICSDLMTVYFDVPLETSH